MAFTVVKTYKTKLRPPTFRIRRAILVEGNKPVWVVHELSKEYYYTTSMNGVSQEDDGTFYVRDGSPMHMTRKKDLKILD